VVCVCNKVQGTNKTDVRVNQNNLFLDSHPVLLPYLCDVRIAGE